LKTRPILTKTIAQTVVRTLASWVPGLSRNTGSQTNVTNKEIKSQIKTHLLGRFAGFKRRQIRPLSSILIDSDTDTKVKKRRKITPMRAPSTRRIIAPALVAVENRP
jgi:hypothetical protein